MHFSESKKLWVTIAADQVKHTSACCQVNNQQTILSWQTREVEYK